MAIVVTAAESGTTFHGLLLRVKVLTGAAASPIGATATQSANAAHQASITTTQTGSQVYGALAEVGQVFFTANANTTLFDNFKDTVNGMTSGSCRTTSATGTPGAISVGASAPSSAGGCALLEILPAGTIAEDASGPAGATTTAASSVSTAAFSPPGGVLLVAMVAADASTATVVTVSGGGLVWTQQAVAQTTGNLYAGVWTAYFAGVPVAPPPVPPGFSSPASFFYTWRPAQSPVFASSKLIAASAASAVITGERVVADQVTGAAAVTGSFSGAADSPALVYYPRLPGPVVRPISYASPGVQVPLTAYAAASGTAAAARTANAAPAGAVAAGAVMAGQKQAAAQLAGNAAALAAISGFELGAGPAAAGYAAAAGMFASARAATTSFAGFAGAALLSSPRSSRHGLVTGYAAVTGAVAGFPPAPPAAVPTRTGSWWQLLDIRRHAQEEFEFYASRPPFACPHDGEPLLNAPPTDAGSSVELYCRFCGWQYPRDYIRPQML